MELHEQGKSLFSNADVEQITGLQPKSARNFTASLVHRGVATRLKPGLFILVPYELGCDLVRKIKDAGYFPVVRVEERHGHVSGLYLSKYYT